MEEKVYKLEKLMDKLSLLEDPHTEYAMLKSCFALPKLSFLMRTVDPRQHQGTLVKFDTAVRQSLERLLGVPLLDHQWLQATLPVSKGGLGLRSAEKHSPCAYTASLSASADIMEEVIGKAIDMELLVDGLPELIKALSGEEELTPAAALASSQKMLSHSIDMHSAQGFI